MTEQVAHDVPRVLLHADDRVRRSSELEVQASEVEARFRLDDAAVMVRLPAVAGDRKPEPRERLDLQHAGCSLPPTPVTGAMRNPLTVGAGRLHALAMARRRTRSLGT